ncbi:hypothetical protein [Burkholderia gladioli]|uniref:hypothetical protein n=1 Tax=Burkholderia gladioli TaxID=28095 RepID=UPI0016422FEE|nr:hypothetical protein [Burkholderia gladioli]
MAAETGDTLTAISQWAYPFPQKDSSAAVDPDAYLAALQGSDGPFPLGLNGLWHGGIHLDQDGGSSAAGNMDLGGGVRCIADGEVVAYCLDSDYQKLTYPDKSTALYSRSFTLVKHKLVLPPVPASTPDNAPNTPGKADSKQPATPPGKTSSPTPAPPSPPPGKPSVDPADTLVFFSLYMHLAPCKVYQHSAEDKNKKIWPGYYNAESVYTVKSTYMVHDKDALDEQENVKTGDPVKGIHVHRDKHGRPEKNLGILPSGSKVKIQRPARAPKGWGRIAGIVSGDIAPITPGGKVDADASTGWVYIPAFDDEINPAALDKVYVLPKPIHISAGEVIGYLGEYQNVQHASTLPPSPQRALLHVEVFAGDGLPAFISRSAARAAQLPKEPKTQLVLEKGAVLYGFKADGDLTLPEKTAVAPAKDSPESGAWAKVQIKAKPHEKADPTAYWIQRSELDSKGARKAWNEFPLSTANSPAGTNDYMRVVNIAGLTEYVDDKKHIWYQVNAGDAAQKTISGFVCASEQAHVVLQNRWVWAGFKLLSSNLAAVDLYKRFLHLKNDNATADEKTAFEASFNAAKSDALITQLDEVLLPAAQRQGKVLGEDLLSALRDTWRANRIDHLVVKYESEWGGQMSKWDALDPFMHDGLPYWKVEKGRIKQLQIWDACKEALKPLSGPSVYHLHPMGIVGNFFDPDTCACGCCLNDKIQVTRGDGQYGPIYWGELTLGNAPELAAMLARDEITPSEKRIIAAMAPNEGKLDTVQSYDDQVITAGAMQKTIRPSDGGGELPTQVADFRAQNESDYQELFARCGWTVEGSGSAARMSFSHPDVTGGQPMTGVALREKIRIGCDHGTYRKYLPNPAIAVLAHALSDARYQKLQLLDFVRRLRHYMALNPTGYPYQIDEYFQGDLGRATVLDQSVNRPGYVAGDVAASLNHLYATYPATPRNPSEWGQNRSTLERALADHYGITRRMAIQNGVSVAPGRYQTLKGTLG